MTEIDGLDIHFIHVRSRHENALPLIITHGWPGSIIEQLKIISPLTEPTAHGGTAMDAIPYCEEFFRCLQVRRRLLRQHASGWEPVLLPPETLQSNRNLGD